MEIIISALFFAVTKIGEKIADKGLEDAYEVLKGKILGTETDDNKSISHSLAQFEEKPSEARQACLKEDMESAGLSENHELIKAARLLLNSSAEGKTVLQQVTQNQTIEKNAKAAQVSGNNNSVIIN